MLADIAHDRRTVCWYYLRVNAWRDTIIFNHFTDAPIDAPPQMSQWAARAWMVAHFPHAEEAGGAEA